jgi:hypothetical protein
VVVSSGQTAVVVSYDPLQTRSCGGHDTRAIQGWFGHRSITSTAVYTALAPNRFKDFWRD